MNCPRIIFAATQSGSGKTTITLGVLLALRKMGLRVQPFKAGPDYLDPLQHSAVCARISRNLDSWLMPPGAILELFTRNAKGANISVIEGVMGLYDGFRDTEYGSTAHLAKILGAPVILVLNAASFSRSAAAIVLGCKEFDKKVNLSGVILNNIGSPNHYHFTKSAIEKKTRIPVLGFLPKEIGIQLSERHLGLVPAQEKRPNEGLYDKLRALVEKNIDLRRILRISRKSLGLRQDKTAYAPRGCGKVRVNIAIAKDKAFNFYYQDNLDILEVLGARLVEFSPLKDKSLPPGIDAMYIGGGYPELFSAQLSANRRMREAVSGYAKKGLPIYAECGGLMYLVKNIISFEGKSFPMAGVFDCSAVMADKRQALGYIEIEVKKDNILSRKGDKIRAHTFHWSYLKNLSKDIRFAYKVTKGKDRVYEDGLIKDNVLASYAHLHFASHINFAKNFIKSCLTYKDEK
ncbi:MAG TPA: cobyrinic acid a,c-diamide synthase [Candidatus Omnitrophica bacterium]|nr:cobyrinic acid a,c-diamide synthase [Candidatus Omnitrophota bacterium]